MIRIIIIGIGKCNDLLDNNFACDDQRISNEQTMTQVLLPASSLLQLQSVREVPLMTIAIMLMIV